ncbi:MAG: S-adenosylmethionine:tRNA ribosyltransferase-isomerase [Micromonosporaceae bacterium]
MSAPPLQSAQSHLPQSAQGRGHTRDRARRPTPRPRTHFALPDTLAAHAPPEARGLARDQVRLLVARSPGSIDHAEFRDLPDYLSPGDLLVVNTSGTQAAAVDGTVGPGRTPVVVHVSTPLGGEQARREWAIELRTAPDAAQPVLDAAPGDRIEVSHPGATTESEAAVVALTLLNGYPEPGADDRNRLWRAQAEGALETVLTREGRPIRYGYVADRWPLASYQTVFATEPGSAEMPSAGRPFSADLVTRLATTGVLIAPVTLHTGVSSQESGELPLPEWFRVPAVTADVVNWTRARGGRVIAVGTTATRALESAVGADGVASGAGGWTNLVIGPDRPTRAVDSLITGLHAPDASHLLLLEAVAGPRLVRMAYQAALEHGYLWHEFGDTNLLLSERKAPKAAA